MAHAGTDTPFYGLMAEFDSAQALLDAAAKVRGAGYTRADAYSPFPIHGLAEALGFRERKIAPIVLAFGIIGALAGYGLEYWTQVIAFPMNVGGRPFHAWVSFIPPAFETPSLLRDLDRPALSSSSRDMILRLASEGEVRPAIYTARPGQPRTLPGRPEDYAPEAEIALDLIGHVASSGGDSVQSPAAAGAPATSAPA